MPQLKPSKRGQTRDPPKQGFGKQALVPEKPGDPLVPHRAATGGLPEQTIAATNASRASNASVDEHWIPVARVTDAWGLAGWIKLEVFGDTQRSVLSKVKRWRFSSVNRTTTSDTEFAVIASRAHGGAWVAQLESICDRDQALALKGQQLEVKRSDFPRLARGEYYWVDLVGCEVYNRDNELLGKVVAMDDHGAHPLLQVKPPRASPDDAESPDKARSVDGAGSLDGAESLDEAGSLGDAESLDDAGSVDDVAQREKVGRAVFYIPFVKHFIDRVSIDAKRIEVDWHADW